MSFVLLVLTCLAGGVGSAARWWCDTTVQRLTESQHPVGTVVVNVVGSFLLGVLVALVGRDAGSGVVQVIGLGLLGGYTTFSSSVVQTVRAAGTDGLATGVVHAGGTALLCVFAALLGLQLG